MPLIDSETWESKSLFLKQLHFHPENPRLPELRGKNSEVEIIHELCKRGDVLRVAKAITEKGYFRHDRLIVLREDGKHIVYEGNRRLCALKLLNNWKLAPDTLQKSYRNLAERAVLPKKIAVEIVPSNFHAEVVMYSKHVDNLFTVKLDPIQQAMFITTKLEEGVTSAQFGTAPIAANRRHISLNASNWDRRGGFYPNGAMNRCIEEFRSYSVTHHDVTA